MPGQEGDFGVLPGHTPLFAGLADGDDVVRQGQEKHLLAVSVGFAEVLPDQVTVLAQVAERAEELDEARAQDGYGARRDDAAEAHAGGTRSTSSARGCSLCSLQQMQQLQAESRRGTTH